MEIFDVIIIGAGQAGLATSYYLKQHKITHVVIEQDCIGSSWKKQRWESFKMNTPNWMNMLPGMDIALHKMDYFMTKYEFLAYLKSYVLKFELPVLEKHEVIGVKKVFENFMVSVDDNGIQHNIMTKKIVVASGIMNKISIPKLSNLIPDHILQLHVANYKSPELLPDGTVLIIGGGQSGSQIAEELALANKKVFLAGSKVARVPRRYKGKDIMEWMNQLGIMDTTAKEIRENPELDATQPQVSGVGESGHTISYQSLQQLGVTILGGLKYCHKEFFYFKDDCKSNIQYADETSDMIKKKVDQYLEKYPELAIGGTDVDPSDMPYNLYQSVSDQTIVNFNDSGISTVLWATGFGYEFNYLEPSLLDKEGRPKHKDGKMTIVGLYCIGFPWLRKKKSGLIYGVKEDSKKIVKDIMRSLNSL